MARTAVYCIVEGQTENAVLKRLIAPHLGARGVDFHAPIVRAGRGLGGVRFLKADDLYDQIRRFLKDRRQPYVTTLFDYYAFPTGEGRGWEFVSKLKSDASFRGAEAVVEMIESEIHTRAAEGVALPNVPDSTPGCANWNRSERPGYTIPAWDWGRAEYRAADGWATG